MISINLTQLNRLEETDDIRVPKCGHVLCGDCARRLLGRGSSPCPTCRAMIKDFYKLELTTDKLDIGVISARKKKKIDDLFSSSEEEVSHVPISSER